MSTPNPQQGKQSSESDSAANARNDVFLFALLALQTVGYAALIWFLYPSHIRLLVTLAPIWVCMSLLLLSLRTIRTGKAAQPASDAILEDTVLRIDESLAVLRKEPRTVAEKSSSVPNGLSQQLEQLTSQQRDLRTEIKGQQESLQQLASSLSQTNELIRNIGKGDAQPMPPTATGFHPSQESLSPAKRLEEAMRYAAAQFGPDAGEAAQVSLKSLLDDSAKVLELESRLDKQGAAMFSGSDYYGWDVLARDVYLPLMLPVSSLDLSESELEVLWELERQIEKFRRALDERLRKMFGVERIAVIPEVTRFDPVEHEASEDLIVPARAMDMDRVIYTVTVTGFRLHGNIVRKAVVGYYTASGRTSSEAPSEFEPAPGVEQGVMLPPDANPPDVEQVQFPAKTPSSRSRPI